MPLPILLPLSIMVVSLTALCIFMFVVAINEDKKEAQKEQEIDKAIGDVADIKKAIGL